MKLKIIALLVFLFALTGCTQYVSTADGDPEVDEATGRRLTDNLLCRPENEDAVARYNELDEELEDSEKRNVEELPSCEDFSINTGGYEGLWTSVLVKPLAWVILKLGDIFNNYGIGLILAGLLIRGAMFPITRTTAVQSEKMKKIKPQLDKLDKKFPDKKDQEAQAAKSKEMMALYKKEGINPVGGCVMALIQLPLFIAFFEAINRIPAIFEGRLIGFQLGTVPWTAIQNGQYHYIVLTLLIVAASYFSFNFTKQDTPGAGGAAQNKFMTIFFVGFIGFASLFTFPVAIGFYWITSTSFTIVQNILVKRRRKK